MLDDDSWLRLVNGLRKATSDGLLAWQSKGSFERSGTSLADFSRTMAAINQAKIFVAATDTASYEISSADSLGRAPHELNVWQYSGTRLKPLGTLRSTTHVMNSAGFHLNQALAELFKQVDNSVESSSEIVDRLLGDLGL